MSAAVRPSRAPVAHDELLASLAGVSRRLFDASPRAVEVQGGGLNNVVASFVVPKGRYVFRTHRDPSRLQGFLKERWATDAARRVGVPTPRVLEVSSTDDGIPYMILEHVEGVPASEHPDRVACARQLGSYAARLHALSTRGYGEVFDWSATSSPGAGHGLTSSHRTTRPIAASGCCGAAA